MSFIICNTADFILIIYKYNIWFIFFGFFWSHLCISHEDNLIIYTGTSCCGTI